MKIKGTVIFLILCLIPNVMLLAQGREPIVMSPLIGEKLDRVEEEYFRLIPAFKNVREAVFYLNPDSTLDVLVNYKYDGVMKDTLVVNYIFLTKLRDYIDYKLVEEGNDAQNIERGKYTNVSTVKDSIIEGELLSVDKTSVILLNLDKESYKQLNIPPFEVSEFQNAYLSKLTIIEESNTARLIYPLTLGIGLGVTAAIISKSIEEKKESDLSEGINLNFTPFLYLALGVAVGALVGYALSEIFPIMNVSETEYDLPFSEKDIKGLRKVTRYKDD
jgi:hypothetical protein